jgi:hypothetical protein
VLVSLTRNLATPVTLKTELECRNLRELSEFHMLHSAYDGRDD